MTAFPPGVVEGISTAADQSNPRAHRHSREGGNPVFTWMAVL